MFLLSIWATGTMYINFDEKHSLNVLKNQNRLQNSTYTTRKGLIFNVLSALFEQILPGINRGSLKNPTWCRAKNSTKLRALCNLVIGIPHTVKSAMCLVWSFTPPPTQHTHPPVNIIKVMSSQATDCYLTLVNDICDPIQNSKNYVIA